MIQDLVAFWDLYLYVCAKASRQCLSYISYVFFQVCWSFIEGMEESWTPEVKKSKDSPPLPHCLRHTQLAKMNFNGEWFKQELGRANCEELGQNYSHSFEMRNRLNLAKIGSSQEDSPFAWATWGYSWPCFLLGVFFLSVCLRAGQVSSTYAYFWAHISKSI